MQEENIVRVGADPFPPYQYYGEDGKLAGSDYETVKSVFETMGVNARFVLDEWNAVEGMMDRYEMDAAYQVQKTPEREKRYCFSHLLRNAETQVVTNDPALFLNTYDEIAQKGLKLGVIQGYTNGSDIDALPDHIKTAYPDSAALLKGIAGFKVDVGVMDKGVKTYLMQKMGIANIWTLENLMFVRPLFVMFNDKSLRDAFNRAMGQ
jgi:polar amino acid transport system substrate-binding protein